MSQSERSRAARIRAKATGQSYQKTLESADGEPTSAQQELEGLFLRHLGSPWSTPASEDESASGIVRLEPRYEGLTVHFGRDTNLGDLSERLLPVLENESTPDAPDDGEVWGVPGLRKRAHEAGTSLFRPGIAAEIVLAGILPEDLVPVDHRDPRSGERPTGWTLQETRFTEKYPLYTGLDIESVMLRRLGIIRAARPWGVHTWRGPWPTDMVIELAFDANITREQAQHLKDDLTSKYLVPQLVVNRFEAPRGPSGSSFFDLSIPSTGHSVQVRLLHSPRPAQRRRDNLVK